MKPSVGVYWKLLIGDFAVYSKNIDPDLISDVGFVISSRVDRGGGDPRRVRSSG